MKKILWISLSFGLLAALSMADDCCKDGKAAKAAKAGCGTAVCAEDAFMAEAKKMMMQAHSQEKGEEACCQTTAVKAVAKGGEGCCNEKGEVAKFKVFVAGAGYKYFGCEDSAGKERKLLLAKHVKVGPVQKVAGKVMIH